MEKANMSGDLEKIEQVAEENSQRITVTREQERDIRKHVSDD